MRTTTLPSNSSPFLRRLLKTRRPVRQKTLLVTMKSPSQRKLTGKTLSNYRFILL